MLIFSHTCLVFKDLIRIYFCEIYVILWDLIGIKLPSFHTYFSQPDCSGDRPDGRPDQESVDRHGRPMCTGRAQRPAYSAGRPRGRPTENTPLSDGGRSIGGTTVIKMTVNRSTGRSTERIVLPFPGCQRAEF